jgi:hypothetical protein
LYFIKGKLKNFGLFQQKSTIHFQILGSWRVTWSKLGDPHSQSDLEHLAVIWCLLLLACMEKNCNNYAENCRHHFTEWSWSWWSWVQCSWYVGYPESKFRLRILPLQRCGHDRALACRVVWFFVKARTQVANIWTVFTHSVVFFNV